MERRLAELTVELEAVLGRLKVAREMGDLSENGAYKYAKFELGNIRREMRRLEHLLADGYVITQTQSDTADFGNVITVSGPRGEMKFLLVSKHESDPAKNKLSPDSPLGRAVYRKKVGEEVFVETPAGQMRYQIVSIDL